MLALKLSGGGDDGCSVPVGWVDLKQPTTESFFAVDALDSETAYVCSAGGIIAKTTNGGATWGYQLPGYDGNGNLYNLYALDAVIPLLPPSPLLPCPFSCFAFLSLSRTRKKQKTKNTQIGSLFTQCFTFFSWTLKLFGLPATATSM